LTRGLAALTLCPVEEFPILMKSAEQNLSHTGRPDSLSNDPRIYLAAERTFLSWIRTGVALMGFGFVVARFGVFLREFAQNNAASGEHHTGFSLPVGVALIGMGILVNVIAAIRHRRYVRAIDAGCFRQSFGSAFAFSIAGLLALIGLAVAIYLLAIL
jgi:putative membrane protein